MSRCQRFDFHRIDPEAIAGRLEEIAGKEEAQLDHDAALLIARVADGAMRDALSLLDQCLGRDRHVTLDIVNQTAGVAAREYLTALAQAVTEENAAAALEIIDGLYKESKDMSRLCEELGEYFRGLMLVKTMKDPGPLLTVSPQELEAMTHQALSKSLPAILHGLDVLEETLQKMRFGSQRPLLEMAFVRLCTPQLDDSPAALLRRVEALETGAALARPAAAPQPAPAPAVQTPPVQTSGETAPEPAPATPAREEPPAEPPQEPAPQAAPRQEEAPPPAAMPQPAPAPRPRPAGEVDVTALSQGAERFREWPEVLQVIKGVTKSVAMAFSGSTAYLNGDYMLIQAPDLAFELLKRPEQRRRIREAVRQVTGRSYHLGPYKPQAEQEEQDPLAELERRAQEQGIPVTEEQPPQRPLPEEDDGPPPPGDAEIPF